MQCGKAGIATYGMNGWDGPMWLTPAGWSNVDYCSIRCYDKKLEEYEYRQYAAKRDKQRDFAARYARENGLDYDDNFDDED
jgi:hypothetical protein